MVTHKPNHGWGTFRLEPFAMRGPFDTKADAEAEATKRGWSAVFYGEFHPDLGSDGFAFREEPRG